METPLTLEILEVYDGKDNLVLLVDGSSGDVGIGTDINNSSDIAHFQHYQSEVRYQSFQSTNGDLAIVTDNNSNPASHTSKEQELQIY